MMDKLDEILAELAGVEQLKSHGSGCHWQDETIGCTCDYQTEQNTLKEIAEARQRIIAWVLEEVIGADENHWTDSMSLSKIEIRNQLRQLQRRKLSDTSKGGE